MMAIFEPQRLQCGEAGAVVTKDGCQIVTNFPFDRLISCGLPGCEVF
jgi:hypothetical protein